MTNPETLPHDIPDDSVEPIPEPAPEASSAPDSTPDAPVSAEPDPAPEPPPATENDPAPEPASAAPTQPDPWPSPVFAAPAAAAPEPVTAAPTQTDPRPSPVFAAPAAAAPDPVTAATTEIERLRLEIAHRDQMLLIARERRLGLEREIGRIERQLDVAIEAQQEAATERAELRRLLGNVQMQVHSLLQLPPPSAEREDAEDAPPSAPPEDEPEPPTAVRAAPRTAESIVYAQPAGADEHETEEPVDEGPAATRARRARSRRRGLVDEARDVLSGLRRLW